MTGTAPSARRKLPQKTLQYIGNILIYNRSFGGERGIRTLEGLLTLTPLAGVRLRPLGHLSTFVSFDPARAQSRKADARRSCAAPRACGGLEPLRENAARGPARRGA